jgi:protoporphyrinogen oxidase
MENKINHAIVGGGILGLSLALRLAQKGQKVTVFEANPEVGGLAASWKLGDITWDKFYHVILMSDSYTRNLLKDIGIENELVWNETKTGFYTDGKLYSMSNTLEFLKFPPLNIIDKIRLGATIFFASKINNWKKLEKISVEKWLTRLSGKRTFNKIWLPLLKAKLGESYKQASAAFIWATIQRMYAARKSGLKKEMFGYVEGGYARVFDALVKKLTELGVEIKTGFPVKSIKSIQSGGIEIMGDDNQSYHFDKCIVTLPSKQIARICPDISEVQKEQHNKLTYLGVICVSLVLKNSISPYYVTNITDDWVPFTGVIEMSALVDKKHLNGNALIYLPKYVLPDNQLFEKADNEITGEFVGALLDMYTQIKKEDILHTAVARAKNVFVLSTLGYSEIVPPIGTNMERLHILNSAQITNGTLNVNETIQLADRYMKDYYISNE